MEKSEEVDSDKLADQNTESKIRESARKRAGAERERLLEQVRAGRDQSAPGQGAEIRASFPAETGQPG